MALIRGAKGIVYFCHQWEPNKDFAFPANNPEVRAAVTGINKQVLELAPVLNSPTLKDTASVESSAKDVPIELQDIANALKSLTWRCAGIERNEDGLEYAVQQISFWCTYVIDKEFEDAGGWEVQNMLTASRLMCVAAKQRKESRGAHHRMDYPDRDDRHWHRHILLQKENKVSAPPT